MSLVELLGTALVVLFLLIAIARLFKGPLAMAIRLLLHTGLGFGILWLVNTTTAYTGLSMGLNWFNALTLGILGVPGFALLLLLKWVLV